jgi:hypothetical protein
MNMAEPFTDAVCAEPIEPSTIVDTLPTTETQRQRCLC